MNDVSYLYWMIGTQHNTSYLVPDNFECILGKFQIERIKPSLLLPTMGIFLLNLWPVTAGF